MKLKNKHIPAILCFSAALGMSIVVGSSSPFIGLMLGTIILGVYVIIFSGKWNKQTRQLIKRQKRHAMFLER